MTRILCRLWDWLWPEREVECLYDEWKRAAKRMGTDGVK